MQQPAVISQQPGSYPFPSQEPGMYPPPQQGASGAYPPPPQGQQNPGYYPPPPQNGGYPTAPTEAAPLPVKEG